MQFNGDCQMLSGVQRFPIEKSFLEIKKDNIWNVLWYKKTFIIPQVKRQFLLHTWIENLKSMRKFYFIFVVVIEDTNLTCHAKL